MMKQRNGVLFSPMPIDSSHVQNRASREAVSDGSDSVPVVNGAVIDDTILHVLVE